jgi:hypothetical protein
MITSGRRTWREDPHAGESGEGAISPLLVYLHRACRGQTCVAEFWGALTAATLVTIDAVGDLIDQEESVILDFTRVRTIDVSGANAVAALAQSMRSRGSHLVMRAPSPRTLRADLAQHRLPLRRNALSGQRMSHDSL